MDIVLVRYRDKTAAVIGEPTTDANAALEAARNLAAAGTHDGRDLVDVSVLSTAHVVAVYSAARNVPATDEGNAG